ncbi:ATP-binding protein [Streptomyces sp. NPDC002730]|uniref:ATP-binding protein n=1 Tax=Streptomyces sp. NPDC002730 TaxID=3364662 RepID=UPI0036848763
MTPRWLPAQMATTPPRHAYVLDGDATAPSRARRHVRDDLTSWRMPAECIDNAVAIVSELTTNAVEHTDSERIRVEIERFPDEVQVAVRDSGPRPDTPFDEIPAKDHCLSEHGRGLDIVRRLATRWGASPTPGSGLRVWAAIEWRGTE